MISVVVPTLDEAANLGRLLAALAEETEPHDVIVVDGGSRDDTALVAAALGARVVHAPRGRGTQLRAGADIAAGAVLLFLHADSRLPRGGLRAVAAALAATPVAVGGNFRLVFDGGDRFSRGLTRFYRWMRSKGLYYGDSGVFVRREVYERLGGIRPIALMEDYDFTRRLERAGPTCCIDAPPLVTSSRRFRGRSATAIVAGWLLIHALYHLGVAPARLERLYARMRPRRGAGGLSARSAPSRNRDRRCA